MGLVYYIVLYLPDTSSYPETDDQVELISAALSLSLQELVVDEAVVTSFRHADLS